MFVKKSLGLFACMLLFLNLFSQEANAGTWRQGIGGDKTAWWYDNGDGTFPVSAWMWIDGNGDGLAECYYFDEAGRMLHNTKTPDGYTVDENGAWTLGFVRQQYVLNSYQIEIFKDAAEGLLYLYGDQLYGPGLTFKQLRNVATEEENRELLRVMLSQDTKKAMENSGAVCLFTPWRLEENVGYFDPEPVGTAFKAVFGMEANPESVSKSERGELMGTVSGEEIRYRITDCKVDSDGSFVYMEIPYDKIDVKKNETLRAGVLYMELYRNESHPAGYTIDIISSRKMQG